MNEQPNNPLHGIKLAEIVEHLAEKYGWEELGERIKINCFNSNPSIKSSLKFLRKTPWAREKVERLYLQSIGRQAPRKRSTEASKVNRDVADPPVTGDASHSPWEAAKKVRQSRE